MPNTRKERQKEIEKRRTEDRCIVCGEPEPRKRNGERGSVCLRCNDLAAERYRNARLNKRVRVARTRPPYILRRLAVFCKNFGFWPKRNELLSYLPANRAISTTTIYNDMKGLIAAGLAERYGSGPNQRLRVTDDGFAYLHMPIVTPKYPSAPKRKTNLSRRERALELLRTRVAAAELLDTYEA